ncbi:hypothetical protein ACFLZX_05380 [Nanoarchaeota archaeon]
MKKRLLINIGMLLLVVSLAYAFDAETSSFSIDSFHQGSSGSNGSTTNFVTRDTLTYEQGGNDDGETTSFEFNSGWFNLSLILVTDNIATINSVECSNDSTNYYPCTNITYNMTITHIRVNCTATGDNISNVRFNLFNQEDNTSYIDNVSYTYNTSDFFIYNASYLVQDSGNWNLTITCRAENNATQEQAWFLPWGLLNITLVTPVANTVAQLYEIFTFQSRVECEQGECGIINVTLDPEHCEEETVCTDTISTTCENITTEVCEDDCTNCEQTSCINETTEVCEEVCTTDEESCTTFEESNVTICDQLCEQECREETTCVEQECTCNEVCEQQTVEECEETVSADCETKMVCKVIDGEIYEEGDTLITESKEIGEKIEDEPDYETHFASMQITDDELIVIFFHDYENELPIRIEGDVSYKLSKETAIQFENITLTVDLVEGVIPRFNLHIGEESEVFEFGKVIPDVEIEEVIYNIQDRDDLKLNVEIIKVDESIIIKGIEDVDNIEGIIEGTENELITTSIAAVKSIDIEKATITLNKKGDVNAILKCDDKNFDYDTLECSKWEITNLAFKQDSSSIEFTANHFTAYAGGNINNSETGWLIIWDENDVGMPNASQTRISGQGIIFFADYKNTRNGTTVTDASCGIEYSDGNSSLMTYNTSYNYYTHERTFSSNGVYSYTIECNHSTYSDLSTTDTLSLSTATKSGAVSTTVGATPFYTTSQNPQNCTILRMGDQCLTTWLVNTTGVLNTIHTFFVIYNMTSNQAYVNDTESTRINITITANDTSNPSILSANVSPDITYLTESVYFFATASDNVQIDTCIANITLSNTTVVQVNDVCDSQQTYVAPITGRHNVTFIVNDTDNNIGTSTDYFEVFDQVNFTINLNVPASTVISFYNPENGELIKQVTVTNGSSTISVPDMNYNLEISTLSDRLHVILRNINLSANNNRTFGLTNTSVVSGDIGTYAVNNNFTFDNATITIYYDNLNVTSEALLELYLCSNYNYTNESCSGSWTEITSSATQDTANDYFRYNTNTFSGFSIKQGVTTAAVTGGGSSSKINFLVEGQCVNKEIKVSTSKSSGRLLGDVDVEIYKGNKVVWYDLVKTVNTNGFGAATFTLNETGNYTLKFKKSVHRSSTTKLKIIDCPDCEQNDDCKYDEYCYMGSCIELYCDHIEDHKCVEKEEVIEIPEPKPPVLTPEEPLEKPPRRIIIPPFKPADECAVYDVTFGKLGVCWYWWLLLIPFPLI